jgi:hypothetical protein
VRHMKGTLMFALIVLAMLASYWLVVDMRGRC